MPTVAAAGYPTGPEAPPQIDPRLPVDDYQRIQPTPEAFGAQVGQSMSALGRVLTTSADEFRQVAMERQQLHNNVVSDKAINDFNDSANNLLYGDPNAPPGSAEAKGYYGLRGQDAIDAYPKMRAALQASREQMRGQLENPMQQLNFDKETRRQMSLEMGRAGSHYDQQYDVFQTATNKAGATLAQQQMERTVGDDVAFNAAAESRMKYEYQQLQAQGLAGNDNEVWAMQQRVRSDAVKTQLEVYAGREDADNLARIINRESGQGGALSAEDALHYRGILSSLKEAASANRALHPGAGGGAAPGSNQYPGEGNEFLKNQRASHAQEIENTPGLKDKILAMASLEDGADPAGPIESLFNRAAYSGTSISNMLNNGFYGTPGSGKGTIDRWPGAIEALKNPDLRAKMEAGLNTVIGGSNRLQGATDQGGAGDPNAGWQGGRVTPSGGTPGAIYNDWGAGPGGHEGAAQWRQEQQQKVNAAGTSTTTPPAPGSAAQGKPIAIGDSIARGFQKFGGAGGTGKDLDAADTTVHAAGGRSPSTILRYLKSQPDGSLKGQPVIFSTGVSNGPNEITYVPDQLAELKRMGAGPISVVGVGTKAGEEGGNRYDLNKYNAQIEQAAKAAGATFLGGLPAVVHPAASYYTGAMPKTGSAAAKSPTVTEGDIIHNPKTGEYLQNVGGKLVRYLPPGV